MTQSILIWGAPPRVKANQSIMDGYVQSGNNFGNLLIGNSVNSFLSLNEIVFRSHLNRLKKLMSVVVI